MIYTYDKYVEDVLSGREVACQNILRACRRYKRFKYERDDIYFDEEDVQRKIRFVSKLKHTLGQFKGVNFNLLPWQQWIVASIYGFKYKHNNLRVTQNVLLFVSRKNGKTALAAALALISLIADKEFKPEVALVANTAKQAEIAFNAIKDFSESIDPDGAIFTRYRSSLRVPILKGEVLVCSSDSRTLDGYNTSTAILDEFHAQKNWDLYNVTKSSQGNRRNPLMIIITTAGFYGAGYPLYEYRDTAINVLKGNKEDDKLFAAIYELDEADDWTDESVWKKASPNLDITVERDFLRGEVMAAQNTPSLQVGVLTKNFNKFVSASDVWIADEFVKNAMQPIDLQRFINEEPLYAGVDLSSRGDITAWSVMFPPNPNRDYLSDKYVFKTFLYVPDNTLKKGSNAAFYQEHEREGYIIRTSGNVIDYDYILKDMLDFHNNHYIHSMGYDSWNSTQWSNNAQANGLNIEPYAQSLGSFNKPTKEFERLILSGKVVIDYNPVIRWMLSNCEIKTDANGNIKPVKLQSSINKIDGVISMLEALGVYLLQEQVSTGEVLFA